MPAIPALEIKGFSIALSSKQARALYHNSVSKNKTKNKNAEENTSNWLMNHLTILWSDGYQVPWILFLSVSFTENRCFLKTKHKMIIIKINKLKMTIKCNQISKWHIFAFKQNGK